MEAHVGGARRRRASLGPGREHRRAALGPRPRMEAHGGGARPRAEARGARPPAASGGVQRSARSASKMAASVWVPGNPASETAAASPENPRNRSETDASSSRAQKKRASSNAPSPSTPPSRRRFAPPLLPPVALDGKHRVNGGGPLPRALDIEGARRRLLAASGDGRRSSPGREWRRTAEALGRERRRASLGPGRERRRAALVPRPRMEAHGGGARRSAPAASVGGRRSSPAANGGARRRRPAASGGARRSAPGRERRRAALGALSVEDGGLDLGSRQSRVGDGGRLAGKCRPELGTMEMRPKSVVYLVYFYYGDGDEAVVNFCVC
nr:uncharacterized protein LOC127339666 [Lolium perenne]